MSLNLQNDGIAAVRALRTSPAWEDFRNRLRTLCQERTASALTAPPEHQAGACGYAAALMHLCVAIESAETGAPQQAVKKPGPLKD